MQIRKIALFIAAFSTLATIPAVAKPGIMFANADQSDRKVKLTGSSNNVITFDVNLPGLDAALIDTKGGPFVLLSIPGYGYDTELGRPKVPVISEWVEIPQGASIEASFQVISSEGFTLGEKGFDRKLMPVQLPVPKMPGADEQVPFSMDKNIYSTDAFYGRAKVTVTEPMQMRGHRAVLVSFWPVAYNPVSGEVKAVTKARISLKLSGADMVQTGKVTQKYRSGAYDGILSSTLLNYNTYQTDSKSVPALPVNELVIVGDQYYDAVQPLVEWDIRKGYRVSVIQTSAIPGGADTAHIRQYIKSQYDGENPPDFVLLVGDVDAIPVYYTTTGPNYPITDLYYSTMSGTDFVPDLYVSRISVADTIQLHDYIAKYLGYQQGQWTGDDSWMRKAFFTASTDNYFITEETDNYCITLSRAHGMICDSAYQRLGGSTVDITDAFNGGITIMTYTGHGSTTSWATPSFYQSNVNALTNQNMYSLVTSFACLTGQFTVAECFGETWIRAANKGALAYWGSSVNSYWDEDDILQRRMYDALLDSGYTWIGGMTLKAKLDFGRYYNWSNAVSVSVKIYFEQYNLLGNSAIDLYTQQPLTMTVNHPASVPLGPATVNINVTAGAAVQNALVCLTTISGKEVLATGYTDASGDVSLDIVTTDVDSIRVVVTAHNCEPYQGQMNISVAGPCVMHYKHELLDSLGNNDGQANPGESIIMPLWVRNYGNVISTGTVTGILRCPGGQAAFTDSFHNFGLVYSGDSVLYASGYRFNVSLACSNGTSIPFVLECSDTENNWSTGFSVTIAAPKVAYDTYSVIDPSPANNNGFAEPGETDSLRIFLKNNGLQLADNVTATISTDDPYVTIMIDSSGYGDIASDSIRGSNTSYLMALGIPPQNPYYAKIKLRMTTLEGALVQSDSFILAIAGPGFYDNVEDSTLTGRYQAGDLWHTTDYTSYSPTNCWRCGVGDDQNYTDNMNSSLVTPEFVLGTDATVSFWHKYWIESGYDYGFVEYTTDGGDNWIEVTSYTGNLTSWTKESFDITEIPAGSKVMLRFRFTSDISVNSLGWHIDDITVSTPAGVATPPDDKKIAASFSLGRNYPNPMNGRTTIAYQIPKACRVNLTVYNILGQAVKILDSGAKEPGSYQAIWDGSDQNGKKAAAGIYFYRLTAENVNLTQKLIIIK